LAAIILDKNKNFKEFVRLNALPPHSCPLPLVRRGVHPEGVHPEGNKRGEVYIILE
jgi:hypothetical protein